METIKKMVDLRLITIVTITLFVSIYFTMAGSIGLYANGKQVASSGGEAFVQKGKTYAPLEAVAKGMGDKYSYNSKTKTATVKKKDGKVITVKVGNTVGQVNKKSVALSTKKVKGKTVSSGHKSLLVKGKLYVPYDFLKNGLGYPVTIKKEGKKTNFYVGKLPAKKTTSKVTAPKQVKPTPAPTKPATTKPAQPKPATPKPAEPKPAVPKVAEVKPTPTPAPPKSGFNKESIIDNLVASYPYKKVGATGATLNIYNKNTSNTYQAVMDLTDDDYMHIEIKTWKSSDDPATNIIPSSIKGALKLIIPSGANHIYSILENGYKNGSSPDLNKSFSYDGFKVKVTERGGSVVVLFSK